MKHTNASILFAFITVANLGGPVALAADGYAVSRAYWENGLDAKLTSIVTEEAPDVTAPKLMLSAQWNYKFATNTFIGGALSSLPQPHTERTDDAVTSYAMYYGGLNVAQGLLDLRPFRLVVTASAGKGLLYARTSVAGGDEVLTSADFSYVEPGIFATFYQWDDLEFGAVFTSRIIKLDKSSDQIDDGDLSSISYGLTFRTQRR